MNAIREPLFLQPVLFEKVWGGNRLGALYGKACPPGGQIGESWELTDRAYAQSTVSGGAFDGWTLRRLMEERGTELLGWKLAARKPARFPLLVKFVDAGDDLSVQVHPDDDGARKFGIPDRGKTECWAIVHAEPGARIQRGLKPGVTRARFEDALKAQRLEEVLHYFEPRVGEVLAIPPGMIHAICAGVVVAEIQQNSDITFRVYDYNRAGLDGKPRALHVRESLETIAFGGAFGAYFDGDMNLPTVSAQPEAQGALKRERLLRGMYFDLERMSAPAGASGTIATRGAPKIVMALQGRGSLGGRAFAAGQTVLLPADLLEAPVRADASEPLVWLESTPTAEA
ncbi:MAG: class I mannose-6-phosphate isomerase [Planctomycetes bacterium]|nr:class I mannose-6-phosphate isomerase [Planctomycetota bacterium]